MFEVNVSKGKDNYSQRRSKFVHVQKGQLGSNKIDWTCVCNVHALVQALLYSGWQVPADPVYKREPDAFANFIVQDCLKDNNWFKTKMPALWSKWYEGQKNAYTPLELHEVLAHYVNEWLGCTKADEFRTNVDVKQVFRQIYENGLAVPTSVQWGNLLGHVITIVGFKVESEEVLKKWLTTDTADCPIATVIYDDPYGLFNKDTGKYEGDKSGNDNELDFNFFVTHWKPLNNSAKKYAHLLEKPVTVV